MNTPENDAQPSDAPEVKPLPQGYLWRVILMVSLLLGASMCFLFVNSILGAILMLGGLAFGKFSSLHDLEKDVIAASGGDTKAALQRENASQ